MIVNGVIAYHIQRYPSVFMDYGITSNYLSKMQFLKKSLAFTQESVPITNIGINTNIHGHSDGSILVQVSLATSQF